MLRYSVTSLLIIISAIAGWIGSKIGLPLPFMLGPLIASGIIATTLPHRLPGNFKFPQPLRELFITVIGLMIGARVTLDLFTNIASYAYTFTALTLFTGLAFYLNYLIFRHLGQYDKTTALFSSSPGGLYESISFGEENGADMTRLMLQQFMRIIVVVTILPVGLSIWMGAPVGSSAGISMARDGVPLTDLWIIGLTVLAGFTVGRYMHLPAGQLTGPLLLAALLSITGLLNLNIPQWLVNVAQIIIGTALGIRFVGITPGAIIRGCWLSVLSVSTMLLLALLLAFGLQYVSDQPIDVLLISFSPGGVTEMALIALSLHANPAFVTLHHIYRILITVLALGIIGRKLKKKRAKPG